MKKGSANSASGTNLSAAVSSSKFHSNKSNSSGNISGNTATASDIHRDFKEAITASFDSYLRQVKSNPRLRLIDLFSCGLVLIGIVQFLFVCLLRDNYPFNAFLAGFIICVGQFVLLMCLRLHLTNSIGDMPNNRAFGEFLIASLVLHFVCLHFIN